MKDPITPIIIKGCVQCGFCCTLGPCGYADWHNGKCSYLNDNNKCTIMESVFEKEKHLKYPMFGSGCSSTMFNEMRDKKIEELKEGLPKTCTVCQGYMVYINDSRRVCETCGHVEEK